jgi:multiple sugar transport system ATP-binding protein
MVFQNYALYPHMTVRQNLGYALRVRKRPKKEIARRVEEVAKLLGLDGLLDRRPGALSGGQMQRVAMGRAIVREPEAFLMDEPLSNLDAKLRVSMRTSLQQLHRRIGTTTVYVTHDQIEAMTLGEPANIFVAAFIGSPAMNLIDGRITDDMLHVGDLSVPLDRKRRPAALTDSRVVVGIRPEAFEDAAFATAELPQIEVTVEVLESVGSDAYVFFETDADAVVVEDALSDDANDDGTLLVDRERALFAARVDARTTARVGDVIRLTVDPSRLYFFSPETGESLLGRTVAVAA